MEKVAVSEGQAAGEDADVLKEHCGSVKSGSDLLDRVLIATAGAASTRSRIKSTLRCALGCRPSWVPCSGPWRKPVAEQAGHCSTPGHERE